MSLFALGPGGAPDSPLRASLGIGPAEVVVSLALVYVLAYLYLQEPVSIPDDVNSDLRVILLSCAVPLGFAFLGIVLYTAFTVV